MINAYITNLGKYNEGDLVGEWVTFPTDREKLAEVFDRIGLNEEYEEFFITDYDIPDVPEITKYLGEYTHLDEINYLAAKLEDLKSYELDNFRAVCQLDVYDIDTALSVLDNLDDYSCYSDVYNDYDLGWYYIQESGIYDLKEMGNLANYIDYEQFGRDVGMEENGCFTDQGYVCNHEGYTQTYFDLKDIPDEYRVFSQVDNSSYIKTTELSTEEGYSFIDGTRNNLKPENDEQKGKTSVLDRIADIKEAIKQQDKSNEKSDKKAEKSKDFEL